MGYNVYLAYDDPDDIRTAAIMVLNGDNSELLIYILGDVMEEEDHFKIVDVDEKEDGTVDNLPFEIGEVTAEGFTFKFKDGGFRISELHGSGEDHRRYDLFVGDTSGSLPKCTERSVKFFDLRAQVSEAMVK